MALVSYSLFFIHFKYFISKKAKYIFTFSLPWWLRWWRICLHCWPGFSPWRRKWQPTPVFLPGESHGEEPGRLQSRASQRVRHNWACTHEYSYTGPFVDTFSFILDKYLHVKFLCQGWDTYLNFIIVTQFSKVIAPLYISTGNTWEFWLFYSLPTLGVVSLFKF